MSPTEHDLRAALRHGEGDVPSADRIVIAAQRRRAQRRTHLLSVAGAVVVVAGVASGLVALTHGGNDERSAASKANGAGASMHSSSAPGAAAGQLRTPSSNAPAASCPAVFPHFMHPGSSALGSDGPLFTKPVSSVLVCAYGESETKPARAVLTGENATQLVESLDDARTLPTPGDCRPGGVTYRFAMIGFAADGSTAGTVTAILDCDVTNGTAVRLGWWPPDDLRGALTGLYPGAPSGTKHASPIRS